jgi:glycosyltransferase involved in cell wall biosynthesis
VSRILLLLPSDPSSHDSGARIRNAGLLSLLREEHHVDTLVAPPWRRSAIARFTRMAASPLPDMAQRLWSPSMAKAVAESAYDAVQAEGIEMARYLLEVPPQRRIYDAHNAEFLLQERLAHTSSPLHAAYSRIQWRRLGRFEGDLVRHSRMTLAVSEHDANQLIALAGGGANVQTIPNAVDVRAYPFHPPANEIEPNMLFLGKLDFRPNADALREFIGQVLPLLPDGRLFAVGAAPPDWLIRAGQHDSRVAVTGYVSDERPYFARAAAMVLPVKTGGGSRLKALVAMARGLPIISTRLGMEGIEAEPGVHYLLAHTPDEWARSINCLLHDAELRRAIACRARALVEQRYDWSAMRPRVQAAYAWLNN